MIQIFTKKDGAISVFLTIILVPMIVISCLFVDASRLRLAKGVVSSAGDLTLNTVLTQYDPVLNDYYGLLASSQDIDSFLATADDYFMACITSQGVEKDDARKYVDMINGFLNGEGGEISDLLQITTAEGGEFTVTPVENGNLANPALMKKEIVEFMKYRAPINAVAELFEKFQDSADELQNAEKDADLIEKKQAYYDAEGKVVEQALEVYKVLLEYKKLDITKDSVDEMKNVMNTLEEKYKSYHIKMVKDLYNTQDLIVFNAKSIKVNYSAKENDVKRNQPNTHIYNAAISIHDFVNAAKNLQNQYGMLPTYNSSTVYDIQYWETCDEILEQKNYYSTYANKANSMIENVEKLKTVIGLLTEDEKNEEYTLTSYANTNAKGTTTRWNHYESLVSQYNSLKSTYITNNDAAFWQISERLSFISKANIGNISTANVNSGIKDIYSKLNAYYTQYDDAYDCLGDAVKELNKLEKKIEAYDNRLNEWSDKANSYESDLSKSDQEEIETLEKDVRENVTKETITELRNRLNNIKSLLGGLKKGIDEYKYNGTSVRKIDSYSKFRKKSGVNEENITYKNSELKNYAESSFQFENSDTLQKNGITKNNNPAIDSVNVPKLYTWLKNKFSDYEANPEKVNKKIKEGKQEYKNEQNKEIEDDEVGYFGSSNEISSLGSLPSSGKGAQLEGSITKDISKISEFVTGLFSNFSKTVGGTLINARDSLFTLEYIMEMFSYDTYEYEGKYHLTNGNVTLSNYSSKYSAVDSDWKNTEVTFTENKSLTNKMINTTNNYSYGNEVEYILYGSTNEKNKDSAYGSIFAIRYALNLAPMFQRYFGIEKSEDRTKLELTAGSIQTATQGIVPASLFKIVVVLGLTAGEAARDIQYLSKGIPVKLVKKIEEIEVRYGDVKEIAEAHKNDDLAFFYSDYIKLILLLKLSSSSEYAIYARVADVVQANMGKVSSGFAMQKANVYYSATAKLQIEPLMLELPIVNNYNYNVPENGTWNSINYKGTRGY